MPKCHVSPSQRINLTLTKLASSANLNLRLIPKDHVVDDFCIWTCSNGSSDLGLDMNLRLRLPFISCFWQQQQKDDLRICVNSAISLFTEQHNV